MPFANFFFYSVKLGTIPRFVTGKKTVYVSFLRSVGTLTRQTTIKKKTHFFLCFKKVDQNFMKHKNIHKKSLVLFSWWSILIKRKMGMKFICQVFKNIIILNIGWIFKINFLSILDHFQVMKKAINKKWFWTT